MIEITLMIVAYLLGSIPSGVWIGKAFFQTDIRNHGSGNSGTTNTYRILGKWAGTIVLVMDIAKGTIAALLPIWFGLTIHPMIIGLLAIIGHVYPIFAKFKGGKAVATTAGVALGAQPLFVLVMILLFGIILYTSSMVSLASVLTFIVAALTAFITGDWMFTLIVWLAMILVVVRHKENIARIRKGEENKVPFGLNQKK
ncbi:MAG: glycerol-3-phosphate 1-O-acyltransferase PlsY [Alkalibacterium sp.]|uniref:Glycerol-3-phosphate acyltransferase n=1 Tax=Alkalibacterium gilvum TaxID=1130080 RepID=A0A1H6R351_9LACT|nr:glycerol-3-phosphate 1-O-acyltransferase PlsY [Alkalibacterium gilvum]MDN6326682.1 glycerol-3-phosphate 1-O-acyltransferase PlsY [Alkalibacterium sp.]MDN6385207.1 glycerol-3-phosphate 1-O-acyltransferase PlsY [Alkalibacterium sp.]SEI50193.1 glycerol-3-phosphate acyltransferase PlsY [Alkalibacterium gilvum]